MAVSLYASFRSKLGLADTKIDYLAFVFARALILVLKPLFLWVLINGEMRGAANDVSLYFLALGSVMVVFSNEAHLRFYKKRYSMVDSKRAILLEEARYYDALFTHMITFSPLVILLIHLITENIYYTLLFFVMILLEKFFDEIQRFLQFEKRFLRWSKLAVLKVSIPTGLSLVCVWYDREGLVFPVYMGCSIVIGVLVNLSEIGRGQIARAIRVLKEFSVDRMRTYFRSYRELHIGNQLQCIATRNILMLDRLFIRFVNPARLSDISFMAQLCTFPSLFFDYFVINHRRKEYLNADATVFSIVSVKQILLYGMLGFTGLIVATLLFYSTGLMADIALEIPEILLMGLYYSLYAVSVHFSNFNFWNRRRVLTLAVDVAFYVLAIVVFFLLPKDNLIFTVAVALCSTHVIRLFMQLALSKTHAPLKV